MWIVKFIKFTLHLNLIMTMFDMINKGIPRIGQRKKVRFFQL